MKFPVKNFLAVLTASCFVANLSAHESSPSDVAIGLGADGLKPVRPDSHAPIGVMADHTHKKGEWMLSYHYQYMSMQGNRIGKDSVSPETIATTIPNRFFGSPMQPSTLRVVPIEMNMEMHMFGGMYAPADWLTLMLMGMYMKKDMDHITFMGGMGTTRLGEFNTRSSGFGDTKITGMFEIFHWANHRLQLNAGVSLPTGSIKETDDVLTPMNTWPTLRLPYAMQLGSGTWDLLPGIVYGGNYKKWGWGAQYAGTIRTGTNDQGYTLGDKHMLTGWASYRWLDWLSNSIRVEAEHSGRIEGIDRTIMAPVQTADPDNYGGDTVNMLFGFNLAGQRGVLRNHRLALEVGLPVYRNLNGPQLETDMVVTAGWQYAF
jgi:hypothetical protein